MEIIRKCSTYFKIGSYLSSPSLVASSRLINSKCVIAKNYSKVASICCMQVIDIQRNKTLILILLMVPDKSWVCKIDRLCYRVILKVRSQSDSLFRVCVCAPHNCLALNETYPIWGWSLWSSLRIWSHGFALFWPMWNFPNNFIGKLSKIWAFQIKANNFAEQQLSWKLCKDSAC